MSQYKNPNNPTAEDIVNTITDVMILLDEAAEIVNDGDLGRVAMMEVIVEYLTDLIPLWKIAYKKGVDDETIQEVYKAKLNISSEDAKGDVS